MRLAKVFHRVIVSVAIAFALVAMETRGAAGQQRSGQAYAAPRYAPSAAMAQDAAQKTGTANEKSALLAGQPFRWPKMPFARHTAPKKQPAAAPQYAPASNLPDPARYDRRYAAGPANFPGAQPRMQASPTPAELNRFRTPQGAAIASSAPQATRVAGHAAKQSGQPVGAPPKVAATSTSTQPKAPASPSERLLTHAHQLAQTARSEDDYSRIIAACRQAQSAPAETPLSGYANDLLSWALNRRGQLKAQAGREEEAIREFSEAIAADDMRWRACHNRGVLLAQAGQFEQAFDDFNRTIELNPGFAKAYSNRGALFVVAGNLDAAAEDYLQSIELDPKLWIGHRGLARVYHLAGDLGDAVLHYDEAIRLSPEDAFAIASRADVLMDLGEYAEAAKGYEQAIRIDPQSGQAYSGSAWLLATCPEERFRNPTLAIERAKKAMELNGDDNAVAFDTLAAAQASAGDFAAAAQNVREAIDSASADERPAYESRLQMYLKSQPYRFTPDDKVVQASYEAASR